MGREPKNTMDSMLDVARELARKYSTMTVDEVRLLASILVLARFKKGELITESRGCKS